MATRQTVSDQRSREETYAVDPGTMPVAPEGSRERVLDPDDLPFDEEGMAPSVAVATCQTCGWADSDCICGPRTAIVNTQDANGEAIAVEVPNEPGQPELPDMPEKNPGVWPDYQGQRVAEAHASFTGSPDLSRAAASQLGTLNARVSGTWAGTITGHKYERRKKGGGLVGHATVVLDDVSFGYDDLEAVREAARASALEEYRPTLETCRELLRDVYSSPACEPDCECILHQLDAILGPDEDDDEPSALDASPAEALA